MPWWFSGTVWKLTARFSKHMNLVIGATRLQHIKPLGTSRLRAMFPRLRQEVSRPRCLLGSTRREQPLQLRADRLWSCPFVSTSLIQAAKMLVYSPFVGSTGRPQTGRGRVANRGANPATGRSHQYSSASRRSGVVFLRLFFTILTQRSPRSILLNTLSIVLSRDS